MFRRLITSDINTVPVIDQRDGIHEWIMQHPEYQVYLTTVDNGVHAGYEIMRKGVKVGEVYSPFTYHWSAIFFAPDGKRYGLMNEEFEGNHPSIKAFNSLSYHDKAWGKKDGYNMDGLVWVDIDGHKFIKRIVGLMMNSGIVTKVIHSMKNPFTPPFKVRWDDNKHAYVKD